MHQSSVILAVGALALLLALAVGPAASAATPPRGRECSEDRVPTSSLSAQLGARGFAIAEVESGGRTYIITDGLYQMMLVTYCSGAIVVDAPPSLGANIMTAIREVTDNPITHVVYSHAHADHVAGAGVLPTSATFISHEWSKEHLDAQSDPDRPVPFGALTGGGPVPVPSVTFTSSYKIKFKGEVLLELSYVTEDHMPGNLYIWVPRSAVLMKVDIVYPGSVPFRNLGVTTNFRNFLKAHDVILSFPFRALLGGHYGRLGTRADVELQKQYVLDLQKYALEGFAEVSFVQAVIDSGYGNPASPNYQNQAHMLNLYFQRVQDICEARTLANWTEAQLRGVETWTGEHCWTAMEGLRLE